MAELKRSMWMLAAGLGSTLTPPASADEVVLRGSVRLPPGAQAVRLADIADITGPDAERYAGTVVAQAGVPAQALEISIQQVRAALTEAGVHWGKVQLSGRSVIVRGAPHPGAAGPLLMTPAALDQPAATAQPAPAAEAWETTDTLADRPTIRGGVARIIMDALGMPPQRMRLAFEQRDAALLDTSLESSRFEIQPLSNLDCDRIEFCVRTWSGGRIEQQHSVTVRPMLQADAVRLTRDVNRGEVLTEQDLAAEQRWVTPIQASTLAGLVEAVGRVANAPLKAGDVLRKKHIKREVLIKRGDRVIVRCLVGGAVISLDAEARAEGAEGEPIELRKLGERDTFIANVAGPGSAIVNLAR